MKRLLALLLCLVLCFPVLALGEDEVSVEELMEEEDVELDENGNLVIRDEDTGEAFVIKLAGETEEELIEQYAVNENVDYSELEINENLVDNPATDHIVNILLLGVDVRGSKAVQELRKQVNPETAGSGGVDVMLCDVVMILSIDKLEGTLKLTSIARDTKVEIPEHGNNKINYSFGIRHFDKNGKFKSFTPKPELTVRTVNHNFDLNIQYYVATNFYGVEEIIEYLGGVDVDLTKAEAKAINAYIKTNGKKMKNTYDNHSEGRTRLKEENGVQHLDGLQGLVYARLRHVSGGNDLQRTGRTRHLLECLLRPVAAKLKSGELDALNLLGVVSQYFITNMNMASMMMELLPIVLNSPIMSDLDNAASLIEEYRIPEEKGWHYSEDGKYIVLNSMYDSTMALHDFIYEAYWPAD